MSLYPHYQTDFTCDKCEGVFQQKTAYSDTPNLVDYQLTYCANCVMLEKLDKRSLRKTNRTYQFNTSVSKAWIKKLKTLAYQEDLSCNEILEKALDCYGGCKQRKNC